MNSKFRTGAVLYFYVSTMLNKRDGIIVAETASTILAHVLVAHMLVLVRSVDQSMA
jgi:hypothetical protein